MSTFTIVNLRKKSFFVFVNFPNKKDNVLTKLFLINPFHLLRLHFFHMYVRFIENRPNMLHKNFVTGYEIEIMDIDTLCQGKINYFN